MSAAGPILLVEDDEVDVLTVKRTFRDLKISNPLTLAGNGEEALALLRDPEQPRPVIILLDLNMPRMNGFEFLHAAREDGVTDGVPIVVLTSSRYDQNLVEGANPLVAGYMIKPVDYHKFVDVMRAIDLSWTLGTRGG